MKKIKLCLKQEELKCNYHLVSLATEDFEDILSNVLSREELVVADTEIKFSIPFPWSGESKLVELSNKNGFKLKELLIEIQRIYSEIYDQEPEKFDLLSLKNLYVVSILYDTNEKICYPEIVVY